MALGDFFLDVVSDLALEGALVTHLEAAPAPEPDHELAKRPPAISRTGWVRSRTGQEVPSVLVITRREGEEVVIGDPANPIGIVRIATVPSQPRAPAICVERSTSGHHKQSEKWLTESGTVRAINTWISQVPEPRCIEVGNIRADMSYTLLFTKFLMITVECVCTILLPKSGLPTFSLAFNRALL